VKQIYSEYDSPLGKIYIVLKKKVFVELNLERKVFNYLKLKLKI
jgi:hypothetical protein